MRYIVSNAWLSEMSIEALRDKCYASAGLESGNCTSRTEVAETGEGWLGTVNVTAEDLCGCIPFQFR